MSDSRSIALVTADLAVSRAKEEAERTASFMAQEYQEATAEIRRLMAGIKAQGDRLAATFNRPGEPYPERFEISFELDGHRERFGSTDRIFDAMKRRCWRVLVDHLGIKNVMSVANRNKFEHQLEHGEMPEIEPQTILSIICGLAGQAKDFAREAAREVFDILRPRGHWGGQYKTNDAFRVGRKVILTWKVQAAYERGKFRVIYGREQELTAIDGVFHLLDGKGVMREHRGPLVCAINDSPDGRGETTYFKFKSFKNGNLHLEMKRLDLVKELNGQAAGEYVLGEDMT